FQERQRYVVERQGPSPCVEGYQYIASAEWRTSKRRAAYRRSACRGRSWRDCWKCTLSYARISSTRDLPYCRWKVAVTRCPLPVSAPVRTSGSSRRPARWSVVPLSSAMSRTTEGPVTNPLTTSVPPALASPNHRPLPCTRLSVTASVKLAPDPCAIVLWSHVPTSACSITTGSVMPLLSLEQAVTASSATVNIRPFGRMGPASWATPVRGGSVDRCRSCSSNCVSD